MFPLGGVFFHSGVTACPVTTDLIMYPSLCENNNNNTHVLCSVFDGVLLINLVYVRTYKTSTTLSAVEKRGASSAVR